MEHSSRRQRKMFLACLVLVSCSGLVGAENCYSRMVRITSKCYSDLYQRISYSTSVRRDDQFLLSEMCVGINEFLNCLEYIKRDLRECPSDVLDIIEERIDKERSESRDHLGCGSIGLSMNIYVVVISLVLINFWK